MGFETSSSMAPNKSRWPVGVGWQSRGFPGFESRTAWVHPGRSLCYGGGGGAGGGCSSDASELAHQDAKCNHANMILIPHNNVPQLN